MVVIRSSRTDPRSGIRGCRRPGRA